MRALNHVDEVVMGVLTYVGGLADVRLRVRSAVSSEVGRDVALRGVLRTIGDAARPNTHNWRTKKRVDAW